MKLTAKEKRLFEYLVVCSLVGDEPTIGDICRDCHTTPYTLLKKTFPGLMEKLGGNPDERGQKEKALRQEAGEPEI